jgi:hypothetical protein
VLIFVSLFVFLTVFLVFRDVELYMEVIKLFAAFVGGFGGGIGFDEVMRRRS